MSRVTIVHKREELENNLEQLGKEEYFTGKWKYDGVQEYNRLLGQFENIARKIGANIILIEENGQSLNVEFYKPK